MKTVYQDEIEVKMWNFLIDLFLDPNKSDIVKADISRRLFGLGINTKKLTLIIEDNGIPHTYILDIKHHRNEYPETYVWIKEVLNRDNYTCQECGSKKKVEAHHIKSWANYPELRFELSNGLTLCENCHKKTDNYGIRARISNT